MEPLHLGYGRGSDRVSWDLLQAGTVLSTKEADMAKDAGAQFLMSPVTVEVYICPYQAKLTDSKIEL